MIICTLINTKALVLVFNRMMVSLVERGEGAGRDDLQLFCLEHNKTYGQPCIAQFFPFAASPLNLSPVFLLYNFFHLFSFFGLESPNGLLAASHQSILAHIQKPVSCLSTCSALKMKVEDSAEAFYPCP